MRISLQKYNLNFKIYSQTVMRQPSLSQNNSIEQKTDCHKIFWEYFLAWIPFAPSETETECVNWHTSLRIVGNQDIFADSNLSTDMV